MKILGIETSCDDCAASVVEDGRKILSNVVATQIPFHEKYNGVVPEIASRKHTEWIDIVVKEALTEAGLNACDIDGVAVTSHPGLLGSLIVGLSFAKAFCWARRIPFIACNHILSHLYAVQLEQSQTEPSLPDKMPHEIPPPLPYPFLGLLVSGGHTIICRCDSFCDITVLGTTIDDAAGEAFDKVSKFYGFGYPGGKFIDALAKTGDAHAYNFPLPSLHKLPRNSTAGKTAHENLYGHRYDVSYSGLKTAVINQTEQFRHKDAAAVTKNDLAASFQRTACDILLRAVFNAAEDTKLGTLVAGGGVAANSYLRARLSLDGKKKGDPDLRCVFPPLELCGDNAAMVAGLGYQYLSRGIRSPFSVNASPRVEGFKRRYP
jgi:N6-L-threonylcarbamoyladenine synthase